MQITGQLSEDSLPEVFQLIEQVFKTGLLLLQPELQAAGQGKDHYLWFQEGRLVAVADHLDNLGLLSMLKQRNWLKPEALKSVNEWSQTQQPLGSYLKATGTLTEEQLQVLFHAQALQPICALFKMPDGRFTFDTKTTLPWAEMTGLSLSTSEASLLGLRVLRDWKALIEKLPNSTCALNKAVTGKPSLQLDAQEAQVWEVLDGKTSIEAIAQRLQMPIEIIQQIAFRMKIAGLVTVVPMMVTESAKQAAIEKTILEASATANSSHSANPSLMKNLVNLLNTKIV